MITYRRFFSVFLILSANYVYSQDIIPPDNNFQYEVLCDSLIKNSRAQDLSIRIDNASPATVAKFTISLSGADGSLSLVAARINDEDLWLIQRQAPVDNQQVLAWSFNESTGQLEIYPGGRSTPYSLNLQTKLSLSNVGDIQNIAGTPVVLTAELTTGAAGAVPVGSGNTIIFK